MSDSTLSAGGIVVALATYKRPAMLARCLASLKDQDFAERFRVVVVDNDAGASSADVAETAEGIDITYVVEPSPGIAAARNRGVEVALALNPEWIAFIDDDEWAPPNWLSGLVAAACNESADGSHGWVQSVYAPGTQEWVRELGFLDRASHAAGTRLRAAATNNLLLRAEVLGCLHPPFDVALGLVGGEDTKMTALLVRDGAIIVAAPEAFVFEEVPLERQSLEWMRRRARRGAAGWVHIERTVLKSSFWRMRRVLSCLRSCVRGSMFLLSGLLVKDKSRVARGRIELAIAWGTVLGLADRQIREYER
jgi:succinoglycan biosynthesis protein ExoM